MNTSPTKYLPAAVAIILFIVLGSSVYAQGQAIASLEQYNLQEQQNSTLSAVNQNQSRIQAFTRRQLSIVGSITAISGNTLTVTAVVPDATALANIDMSKPFTVPQVRKTYQVNVTAATTFLHATLASLKVGDSVVALSAVPVLSVSTFDATKITLITLPSGATSAK